jgi:hypothetical protein
VSRPKSPDQAFSQSWNKAVAWAQSQGIPASTYVPVYQLDAQRLQTYGYGMSAGERNRAILAAHDPNNVTPAPSDNPQPSNVWGNSVRDLRMIVTGLEPQHLFSGLFHSVVNTVEDIAHPARLKGPSVGVTAANWFQDTLLSFVPGAYDLGTVLRGQAAKPGDQFAGAKALADDPLLSLLDVIPAGRLMSKAAAGTALGARLAERTGMTTDALGKSGLTGTLRKVLMNTPTKAHGVTASGQLADALTIGDRLTSWLQNSKLGTSGPVQSLVKEFMVNQQVYTGMRETLLTPASDAIAALSPEEQQVFHDLFYRHQRGENLTDLMKDPKVTLPVREAVEKTVDGPLRFETEEALAAADVVPVRTPDGRMALYASKQDSEVVKARDGLATARSAFTNSLDATDRLVKAEAVLDQKKESLAGQIDQANRVARGQLTRDDNLLENVTQAHTEPGKKKPVNLVVGRKREQATAVFGPGGLVDRAVDALKGNRDDDLAALVPVLTRRLSQWGAHSVDAKDNPAFAAVASQVEFLRKWVNLRKRVNDEIERRIEGDARKVSRETVAFREQRRLEVQHMEERHRLERKAVSDGKRRDAARIDGARAARLAELDRMGVQLRQAALARAANAKVRATPEAAAAIDRATALETSDIGTTLRQSKTQEIQRFNAQAQQAAKSWDEQRRELDQRLDTEKEMLQVRHSEQRAIDGALAKDMRAYTRAIAAFHQAVWDHPSDEYRNMRLAVYQRQLLEHHRSAELIDAAKTGLSKDALTRLREDPQILRELVTETLRDIFENPENFDPVLRDAAKEADEEATQSAVDEVNTLIAQGYRPQWIPQASTFDRPGSAIRAMVGKGTPHVDLAFARANKMVATRHDVVVGVTKAMSQQLRRDATIDFVENSILPRTLTGTELKTFLKAHGLIEGFDPTVGTLPHAIESQLDRMGLTRVDPEGLFGFTMPRFANEHLFMPSGLVNALQKVMDSERKGDMGVFDKGTRLFRYSILGLSPRYTAHILFGGTFLLALRSTPYMPTMLLKAAKAMREGSIPQEVFRQPTQEGFSRLNYALREHGEAGGKQLATLAIQEHVATVQKIALSKASPVHWLKAAADINFRFTRAVVRMQSAVAYLDHASAAERRGTFVDEVTGGRVAMTKERAMKEGMHHVAQVFGDLRSMSPLERTVARNILPFYGWTRHILKYVLSFPADHPWRAMVLAELGYQDSADIPKGLPERIQFLFFLGSPDAQGNVSAVDTRFMDPLRDVANYATLGGWLQGLNPAILAPLAMVNPQIVYGSNSLYPNLTFDQFYGIREAGSQGSALTGLEQFVPQLGALGAAVKAATQYRTLASTNPNQFYKTIFQDLNIPFAQVQHVNVKQLAVQDENARYESARQAATTAFQTGDFSTLAGYGNVPNPLNPDYEIAVSDLQALYNASLKLYPGQAPISTITPPQTPVGY